MLIEHRVDDVNERFVGVKQSVASGQQVSLQPPLTKVLAQHFHDAPRKREMIIARDHLRDPLPVGGLEHGIETVGVGLVRTKQPEVRGS